MRQKKGITLEEAVRAGLKNKQPIFIPEDLPGCEECPSCKHFTLPRIKGMATGRMCQRCKAVVNKLGVVE